MDRAALLRTVEESVSSKGERSLPPSRVHAAMASV